MEDEAKSVNLNLTNCLMTTLIIVLGIWTIQRKVIYRRFYELADTLQNPDLSLWPLIGHAHHFMVSNDVIYKTLVKFEKYDRPIKLWMASRLYVCLTRPEDMEVCFNKVLDKEGAYDLLKYIWGDGLLTISGAKWKRHRKLLMPAFNQKITDGFVGCFVETSASILEYIERHDGQVFDIGERVFVATVETLRKTSVGYEGDRKESWTYTEVINDMFEMVSTRMYNSIYRLKSVYSFLPVSKRFNKVNAEFIALNNKSWEAKRESYRENREELLNSPETFFDHLAKISENGGNFTADDITSHMQTFILAGSDATFSASAFCLLMLAMHPEIQEKVFAEIQEVIGTSEITASHLARLSYTERVIKETLRLFPVAPVVLRMTTEDTKLATCTIPKGTLLLFATLITHRSPRNYKNPLVFDPDRFLPEELAKRHPYSYHPFTLGPRKCMGVAYGTNLVKTVIATVIGSYRLETPLKSVEDVELKITAVLRPLHGFPVRAFKRQP